MIIFIALEIKNIERNNPETTAVIAQYDDSTDAHPQKKEKNRVFLLYIALKVKHIHEFKPKKTKSQRAEIVFMKNVFVKNVDL